MSDTRLALDVMGGDDAPQATLRGALLAVSPDFHAPLPPERVLLVGRREAIEAELEAAGGNPGFALLDASEVVEMDDPPTAALRGKPDSSISVAVRAVAAGEAGALVSMGNTGAVVACATRLLGTLPGVKRPGIAVTFNLDGKPLTIMDMGANIAPKPEHLIQYGVMGAAYARASLGCEAPRIGLLNIGEEESKGTDLLKEAHAGLRTSGVDFVGNVEGNGLFGGEADLVVTDGFTGNVVLKLLEGFAGFLLKLVLGELASHGASWAPEALGNVKKNIDFAEYGGAQLLGVKGAVVVGHGRSDELAVANALVVAARQLDRGVNDAIVRDVAQASDASASA